MYGFTVKERKKVQSAESWWVGISFMIKKGIFRCFGQRMYVTMMLMIVIYGRLYGIMLTKIIQESPAVADKPA